MNAITTDTKYNFEKAENDTFSWTAFDGTSGKTLTHKESGRKIYQMAWVDTGEKVTDELKNQVILFRDELKKLQNPEIEEIEFSEEEHGIGWCNICHSYCYGDCQAN